MSNEKTEADGVAIADQPLGLLDFATLPPLLDVGTVAALCGCSARHIYRLADCGKIPRPLKIGALVRWRKDDIRLWIDAGCPAKRVGS